MRDHVLNILAIRSDQPAEGDIVIPDLDLPSLSKQPFDELNLRTLAKIISRRFEA